MTLLNVRSITKKIFLLIARNGFSDIRCVDIQLFRIHN